METIFQQYIIENSNTDVYKNIYKTDIDKLHISNRIKNVLKRNGIETIGDILDYPIQNLTKIKHFGDKSKRELSICLYVFVQTEIIRYRSNFITKGE